MTTLKVKFVFKTEYQEQNSLLSGRSKIVTVPVGDVHYFELVPQKDAAGDPIIVKGKAVLESSPWSLCNRTRADIGEQVGESDTRPAGLHICPDCEEKYKNHPASPWRAWIVGVSVFLLFFLLGCLSPSVAAATLTPVDPASTETAVLQVTTEPTAEKHQAAVLVGAPECKRVTAESLHVRDLPGYEVGEVVGYLFGGDVVQVRGSQEVDGVTWYQTREGWSSGAWMVAAECP